MSARPDYIEVVPTKILDSLGAGRIMGARPLSPYRRPHFIRRIDGSNGKTEWHSQDYTTRATAVRAARKAAKAEGLAVVVLDATGEVHRRIEPGT